MAPNPRYSDCRYGCPMRENFLKRGIHLPVLEDIGIFQGYNP